MGSHWTDEEWMVDVIRHYHDGHRIGAQAMKDEIIARLKEHVDAIPDWEMAVELVEDVKID